MSDHYDRYNGMDKLLSTNLASLGTDCISRQAAIDALTEYGNGRAVFISVGEAVIRIEQLPPIQPKRGRWIGKYPVTSVCSECGFLIHDSKVKVFAFCPNCGADMREKGENSESN